MPAATYDLAVEQGAQFERTFARQNPDGTPAPLTGLKARMQIRRRGGDGTLILGLSSDDSTSSHSFLVLDEAAGTIRCYIGASVTATFTEPAVYDIELYDPANTDGVDRLVEGRMLLSKQVTT